MTTSRSLCQALQAAQVAANNIHTSHRPCSDCQWEC